MANAESEPETPEITVSKEEEYDASKIDKLEGLDAVRVQMRGDSTGKP